MKTYTVRKIFKDNFRDFIDNQTNELKATELSEYICDILNVEMESDDEEQIYELVIDLANQYNIRI